MATIDVDFEVFKQLTVRRESEAMTYNDVIRKLLNMGEAPKVDAGGSPSSGQPFVAKGVEFPDGTLFRATYKGTTYTGRIKDGSWLDENGKPQSSPSQAAFQITESGVNGWRFWECRRPSDTKWTFIHELRK